MKLEKPRSLDVFAVTNPAYLGVLLWHFVDGYKAESQEGPELPLLYLVVPLAASEGLATTFAHTNVRTGLIAWKTRNPLLLSDISERVVSSEKYSWRAIEFSLVGGLLDIAGDGRISCESRGVLVKKPSFPGSDPRGRAFLRSYRLGRWMGQIKSAKTIFNLLGVAV